MTPIFITNRVGGSGGTPFSDTLLQGDISTAAIKQITISYYDIVYQLKVKYTWGESKSQTETQHGSHNGTSVVLNLDDDEFITGVEGYSNVSYVNQLTFVTNKSLLSPLVPSIPKYGRTYARDYLGKSGPYGFPTGKPFQWGDIGTNLGTPAPRMRLLAFSGAVVTYLGALQGVFFDLDRQRASTTTANYQGIPRSEGSGSSPVAFATFSAHLKTPVITLNIGPDRVEFHAHEDTLCKLPFFQAALKGSFRESLAKSIDMPEDTPETVSALIEYLYTTNYTYTYDSSTAETQGRPAPNVAEGRYHIGVFVIAVKYDCGGLAAMAMGNFEALLPQLSSVDTLRLWKHAYGEGPDLQTWRTHFERCHEGKWVATWVKELFKNHRQEMEEMIAELPELAADLMRLAIYGKG